MISVFFYLFLFTYWVLFSVSTYGASLRKFHVYLRRMCILMHLDGMFYINLSNSDLRFHLRLLSSLSGWSTHWCKWGIKKSLTVLVNFSLQIWYFLIYFGVSILGAYILICLLDEYYLSLINDKYLSLFTIHFCPLLPFWFEVCFVW